MVALGNNSSLLEQFTEVIREDEIDPGAVHLYSVAALTNQAGAVVERYRYDTYGNRTVLAADGITTRAASSYNQQVGFTGRYLDKETGLWYFRARYFSGTLGRFIGRDPKAYVDGPNFYRGYFVPNGKDPSGTDFLSDPPGLQAADPNSIPNAQAITAAKELHNDDVKSKTNWNTDESARNEIDRIRGAPAGRFVRSKTLCQERLNLDEDYLLEVASLIPDGTKKFEKDLFSFAVGGTFIQEGTRTVGIDVPTPIPGVVVPVSVTLTDSTTYLYKGEVAWRHYVTVGWYKYRCCKCVDDTSTVSGKRQMCSSENRVAHSWSEKAGSAWKDLQISDSGTGSSWDINVDGINIGAD